MSTDKIVLTADSTHALAEHSVAALNRPQPIFWLALSCAAAMHAALIFGISRSSPRYMGEHDGSPDAINVELVDEAVFGSKTTVSTKADNPPAAPVAPAQPPQPDAARPSQAAQPQQPPDPPPLKKEKPEVASPSDVAAKPSPPDATAKASPPDATAKPAPPEAAAKPAPPDATAKPSPPDAVIKPAPANSAAKQSVAKSAPKDEVKPPPQLDLSVPFSVTTRKASPGAQGRSSSATRPPGITRSGENDRFGRDVIRALRKTMPPPRGAKGRVTVRIFLSETGDKAVVSLVQSGGKSDLDQDVIFSVHQASFPFPPKDATAADRTFRVTYVYR